MNQKKHLVVIGGGAAGFFCSVNVARMQPAIKVTLLEKSSRLLSKVRISGGGRCNVTHACFDMDEMSKQYPRGSRWMKRVLHEFAPSDTIKWFQERGVRLITEPDGRMFPSTHQSETIIDCLMQEASKYNVTIATHQEVIAVEKEQTLVVVTAVGQRFNADFIFVATGGHPKPAHFDWLHKLGHSIDPPVPSLFTFNIPDEGLHKLMGISVAPVTLSLMDTKLKEQGSILITHWGISGPAALRLSAFAARHLSEKNYTGILLVNWIPTFQEVELRNAWQDWRKFYGGQKIMLRCPFSFPARLWQFLLNKSGVPEHRIWAELTSGEQQRIISTLLKTPFSFKGKTTFKEEFVTCGGISLKEIHSGTMESKILPGLFFGGEVMDVDGVTGGYNFQHAWSSGWVAAKTIASRIGGQ
jgi:predicted Rossmann fold flavoprotein